MIYAFIKALTTLSLKRFFRKIVVEHSDRVPGDSPTIFVSNHPNTMIDAMVVGYAVGKRIHFVAKSTLFSNRVASWFLRKLGMVPIFRPQDDPDQMHRNVEVFQMLYDLLEKGGCFLLFPEGISEPARRLQPIRTGAARIALGAEEKSDFRLGVRIVPVGLNYSAPERFRSDVYCRFGYPIVPGELKGQYESDPVQAALDLTERIRINLEKLTTHIQKDELEETVSNLEKIYKRELMVDLGMKLKSMKDDFLVTKGIVKAVEWFQNHQPERAQQLRKKIGRYLKTLNRLHIKDEFLSPTRSGIGFLQRLNAWMYLVLGFPLFVWGLINNFVPFILPLFYARRFVKQKTLVSSMKLMMGLGSFAIFYGLQTWLVWLLFSSKWVTAFYAVSLIPSGNFALSYLRKAKNYQQHLIFLSIFYRKRLLIYDLIRQRMRLIEALDRARDEYMAATGTQFRPSQAK